MLRALPVFLLLFVDRRVNLVHNFLNGRKFKSFSGSLRWRLAAPTTPTLLFPLDSFDFNVEDGRELLFLSIRTDEEIAKLVLTLYRF